MAVKTVRRSAANAAARPESMLDAVADIAGTQLPALGNELIADHANQVTFDTEAKADIATIATFEAEAKTDIGTIATFDTEVAADISTIATFEAEAKTDIGTIATFDTEVSADISTIATFDAEVSTDISTIATFDAEVSTDIGTIATFDAEVSTDISTIATFDAEVSTDISTVATFQAEVATDCTINATWETEVDADLDEMNDYLHLLGEEDGVTGGEYTMASTAAATVLGAGHVRYRIGGVEYFTALDTTITLTDDGDITQNKYRAFRIEIDRYGTVTGTADGNTAYTTAEESLLSLSSKARTANTATIGYVVIMDSSGNFNIGTTNTADAEGFAVYYERLPARRCAGLTAALGAGLAVGSTPENYSVGTRDYMASGLLQTQDAAEADKAFDDADTIGQSQYGGHLIVTNLAHNATYSLAANGIAETVSAMTYASAALADAALDTIAAALPSCFAIVGKIVVQNNIAGAFTYGTDDINGTDGTATFTNVTFATYDRTVTGLQQQQVNPPVVPASVTAPVVATMTAPAVVAMTAPAVAAMTAPAVAAMTAPAVVAMTAPAVVAMTAPAVAAMTAPAVVAMTAPAVAAMTASAVVAMTASPNATLTASTAIDTITVKP